MTRPFNACHEFDLDLVFKVTRIISSFDIWNFLRWHKLSSLGLNIFIVRVHATTEDLPYIHQPDQYELCQGHRSNRPSQWKSMSFHLNRHIVLRPLGPRVPYQRGRHLKSILLGIFRIRSLHHHFWIL